MRGSSQPEVFIESFGRGSLAAFLFLILPPAPAVEQPLLPLLPPLCPYKSSHCVVSMCSAENGCVVHAHISSCPHMSYCLTNSSRQTSLFPEERFWLSSVSISSRSSSQAALFYLMSLLFTTTCSCSHEVVFQAFPRFCKSSDSHIILGTMSFYPSFILVREAENPSSSHQPKE